MIGAFGTILGIDQPSFEQGRSSRVDSFKIDLVPPRCTQDVATVSRFGLLGQVFQRNPQQSTNSTTFPQPKRCSRLSLPLSSGNLLSHAKTRCLGVVLSRLRWKSIGMRSTRMYPARSGEADHSMSTETGAAATRPAKSDLHERACLHRVRSNDPKHPAWATG
jgi:hypothetical protein